MLALRKRKHGAEHREPEEQDGGDFVGPGERRAKHIARGDAGKQNRNLGDDETCRRDFDEADEETFEAGECHGKNIAGRSWTASFQLASAGTAPSRRCELEARG